MTYFTINQRIFGIEKDFYENLYRIYLERREIFKCRSNSYKNAIEKFKLGLSKETR